MSPEDLNKVLKSHELWVSSGGSEGEKANFEGAELRGADLRNANLAEAEFRSADLKETNLQGAQLRWADFNRADLQFADLRKAALYAAELKNANLVKADLRDAQAEQAGFEDANLQSSDLRKANLNKARFKNANLRKTNFRAAQLKEASFDGAKAIEADFRTAILDGAAFENADLRKANLQHAELSGASFDSATLNDADLRHAIMNWSEFKNADLTQANLQGAELRRASFEGAILKGTNLREADLQNSNLEKAEFLLTTQLAGADVAGAKLPSAIAEFRGLETIAEATSNAQKLFVAILGGCLYSWLTIGTTKDVALLTNSASSPLPIIGTALPIVGFYTVAPMVLLAMYFYFHLNMQRHWEALSDLPAVFPDGRTLDKRADPWLLNGLVRAHFVRLRRERPSLSRVQQWLSILLAWWVVPATLFVFWGRFLPRHDWFGTSLHIGLLAVAIGFGWMSYRLARETLRGAPRRPFPRRKPWEKRRTFWTRVWEDRRGPKRVAGILGICAVGVIFYLASFGAIEGVPGDTTDASAKRRAAIGPDTLKYLVPLFLAKIGFRTSAYLREEDISVKPSNWTGSPDQYRMVKGADLGGANMQNANATSAFLVNARLSGADLHDAYLSFADLTKADLTWINLAGADLFGADLRTAKLYGADLSEANLSEANLREADLREAKLFGADLSGADLRGLDLRQVKGLANSQIQVAIRDEKTLLPANLSP